MASVITVANQKGGTGKTAISVNLSAGLSLQGYKVLVVDADPQGSTFKHFRRRPSEHTMPLTIVGGAQADINRHLPGMIEKGEYDYVVIDCPAGQSKITRSALLAADHVLIPVLPSFCDFEASEEFIPVLHDVTAIKPGLQVHIVISRKMPGKSRESIEARESALSFFAEEGLHIDVLKTEISERRSEVMRAYLESRTVFEKFLKTRIAEKNSSASDEFKALTEEIICLTTEPLAVAS